MKFFIFFLNFVFVFSTIRSLQLLNICEQDCFYFNESTVKGLISHRVNTFKRIQLERNIPKIEYAYILKKIDLSDYLTENEMKNVSDTIDKFNEQCVMYNYNEYLMEQLFKYDYVGSNLRFLEKFRSQVNEILERHSDEKSVKDALDFYNEKFDNGRKVLEIYDSFKYDATNRNILNETDLEKEILKLGDFDDNQKLIFTKIEKFFEQEVSRLDAMKLNKKSIFFSPQTYATLSFSIYLPFESKSIKNKNECKLAKDLPLFYNKIPREN